MPTVNNTNTNITIQKVNENDILAPPIANVFVIKIITCNLIKINANVICYIDNLLYYLKNRKFVGTALRFPSDGLLITLPLKINEEDPPPSKL